MLRQKHATGLLKLLGELLIFSSGFKGSAECLGSSAGLFFFFFGGGGGGGGLGVCARPCVLERAFGVSEHFPDKIR